MKIKVTIKDGEIRFDNLSSGKKCDVNQVLAELVGETIRTEIKPQYYDEVEVVRNELMEG
jgi:hypothetical protein